jgi:hypothetical protein
MPMKIRKMCSVLQIPFILSVRTALEVTLSPKVKDRLTPSRIAAFIHGVLASFYILNDQWYEAIHSTAQFFLLDLFLHYFFKTKLPIEMIFHHLGGALLCIYSVVSGSYQSIHLAEHLTKALILMETTNPLLQILITLRNEHLQQYLQPKLLYALKFFFFFHFTYTRILYLGKCLFYTYQHIQKADVLDLSMFYLSASMWILQLFWLGKIIQSVRSI